MSNLNITPENQSNLSKDELIEKQRKKIEILTNKLNQQDYEIKKLTEDISSKDQLLLNLSKSNNNLITQHNSMNDINNNLKKIINHFESNENNTIYRTLEENNILMKQINNALLDSMKIISSYNNQKNNHLIDEKINKIEENLFLINKKVTINSLKIEEMQDVIKLLNNYSLQKK